MAIDRKRLGKRARTKGKTWERTIVRLLRPIFPDVYRAHQGRQGGAALGEGADVEGSPWWVEAKHCYTVSVLAALRQAMQVQAAKGDDRPPVVIAKVDKPPPGWRVGLELEPPTATMKLDDWIALVEDWVRLRCLVEESIVAPRGRGSTRVTSSPGGSSKSSTPTRRTGRPGSD